MYYSKNNFGRYQGKMTSRNKRSLSLSSTGDVDMINDAEIQMRRHYETQIMGQMMDDQQQQEEKERQSSGIEVEENHIYFYTDVTDKSSLELIRILRRLDVEMFYLSKRLSLEKNPPIHLHISSHGGLAYACLNICDTIMRSGTDIYTYVEGAAASAATLMSCVGKKRFITKNSFMLIHQPRGGFIGKYDEFHDEMKNQEKMYEKISAIYLDKTKIHTKELDEILKHELWFDSEKCLELGLVDEII